MLDVGSANHDAGPGTGLRQTVKIVQEISIQNYLHALVQRRVVAFAGSTSGSRPIAISAADPACNPAPQHLSGSAATEIRAP
jgi:hypothetical protein